MKNQDIIVDIPCNVSLSDIDTFLSRIQGLIFTHLETTDNDHRYLIIPEYPADLIKIGTFIGGKQRLPPQNEFNLIEDLRPFLLQSPHDHTAACLHYLGDDAQTWWAERRERLKNKEA